jgi:hypothetical protein
MKTGILAAAEGKEMSKGLLIAAVEIKRNEKGSYSRLPSPYSQGVQETTTANY